MNTVQQLYHYCRTPHLGDVEEIVQINRLALPENYSMGYFIQLIKQWKDTSVVSIRNGKIIGYIICKVEKKSLIAFKRRNFPRGHIMSVAVHPEYRRQGIASEMMKFVLNRLKYIKNLKEVILEVRESNRSAIRLYQKFGFKKESVLKRYYIDGESANLMVLKKL